jgi:hypothetical protein
MKVALNGIQPEIWRRFIVDSSISLYRLHRILQEIMGWTNSHLFSFDVRGIEYSAADEEFGDEMSDDFEDARITTLESFHLKTNSKIKYIYDFGDYWEHTIKVEKVVEANSLSQIPHCIEGARNCPPEDCGSVPGYYDLVAAMKNLDSDEAKELIEWLGGTYDSEFFDINEINSILKSMSASIGN